MGNSNSQTRYNSENKRVNYIPSNPYDRLNRRPAESYIPAKDDNLPKYRHDKIFVNNTPNVAVKSPTTMYSASCVHTPIKLEKMTQSGLHNSAYTHAQPEVRFVPSTTPAQIYPLKKESDNEIRTENNKSASVTIELSKFVTRDDFMTTWFSWKRIFLEYMKSIDKTESDRKNWGIMLLNRMGIVGQTIHRTFTFDDDHMKENIDILLKKFDFYCIFGDKAKQDNEAIDKYINSLKVMAMKHKSDTDEIVKEKIIMEINQNRFTAEAKSLIPEFSFRSDINSLTIKEIAYIWMSYENRAFKQNEEIDHFQVRNCNNCGYTHMKDKCPAYGKKCNECGLENHFTTRCPSGYNDCLDCGKSHFKRQCPAYGNQCKQCRRLNHFFWKCRTPKILNCNFCGLSHIPSRSVCSALNTICLKCNQRGHVPSKCRKNQYGNNFRSTSRLNF